MNRRELFAGAGAAALSAAVPAREFAGLKPVLYGVDFSSEPDTTIWVVSWGTGEVVQVEGEVVDGQLYFRRPGQS